MEIVPKRVLIIAHSNFGVGHFNRSKNISDIFTKAGFEVAIAYSGVELDDFFWAGYNAIRFSNPDFWESLEQASSYMKGNKAKIELEASNIERISKLKNIIDEFIPQIIIYEFIPFYKYRFLEEFNSCCSYAKVKYGAKVLISLRDILHSSSFPPEKHLKSFSEAMTLIDRVIFHGEIEFSDTEILRWLKKCEIPYSFTGFIVPSSLKNSDLKRRSLINKKVICSAGGGRDGAVMIEKLDSLMSILKKYGYEEYHLAKGYFSKNGSRAHKEWKEIKPFDYLNSIKTIDYTLSINMAGYNTCWENVYLGIPMIIEDRDRYEQRKRTKLLMDAGLALSIENTMLLSREDLQSFISDYEIRHSDFLRKYRFDDGSNLLHEISKI